MCSVVWFKANTFDDGQRFRRNFCKILKKLRHKSETRNFWKFLRKFYVISKKFRRLSDL